MKGTRVHITTQQLLKQEAHLNDLMLQKEPDFYIFIRTVKIDIFKKALDIEFSL